MTKDFTLTKTQSRIVTSPANYIEWRGKRAVGSTFAAFIKMLVVAQDNPQSVSFYLTKSKQVARHVADEKLNLFDGLGKMSYHDMCFKFYNGSKIFFASFSDFQDDMCRGMRPSVVLDNTTDTDFDDVNNTRSLVIPRLHKHGFMLVIKRDEDISSLTELTYIDESKNPYIL